MRTLVAATQIDASPADVFSFVQYMNQRRYRAWHPEDHVHFEYVRGDHVSDGTVVRVEEVIDGERMVNEFEYTAVVPDHVVEFRPTSAVRRAVAPKARMEFRDSGDGCHFVQKLDVRIGPLVDRSPRLARRVAAIDRHKHEESAYLKDVVENDRVAAIDAGEDPVVVERSPAQQVNVQTP